MSNNCLPFFSCTKTKANVVKKLDQDGDGKLTENDAGILVKKAGERLSQAGNIIRETAQGLHLNLAIIVKTLELLKQIELSSIPPDQITADLIDLTIKSLRVIDLTLQGAGSISAVISDMQIPTSFTVLDKDISDAKEANEKAKAFLADLRTLGVPVNVEEKIFDNIDASIAKFNAVRGIVQAAANQAANLSSAKLPKPQLASHGLGV